MPRMIDLKKIRTENPSLDWGKISEWKRLRRILLQRGLQGRHSQDVYSPQERRARIVDDVTHDSRVVRLQRY
jgi:hypothetical protein